MQTQTETLAVSLDILADEIESPDGVANAAIAEAASRLRELEAQNVMLRNYNGQLNAMLDVKQELAAIGKAAARATKTKAAARRFMKSIGQ